MFKAKYFFIGALSALASFLLVVFLSPPLRGQVLSMVTTPTQIPTPTPTPSPTPSPTPTPTPTPTPSPTPTPTPVLPPPVSSQEIHGFIERFAGQYGIDANILRHIAVCESGFNPLAQNGPYAGLYQFSSSTWKAKRTLMGEDRNPDLRLNAEEAVQTGAFVLSINQAYIWPSCVP